MSDAYEEHIKVRVGERGYIDTLTAMIDVSLKDPKSEISRLAIYIGTLILLLGLAEAEKGGEDIEIFSIGEFGSIWEKVWKERDVEKMKGALIGAAKTIEMILDVKGPLDGKQETEH